MLRYGKLRSNEPLTTSSGYVCSDLVADHNIHISSNHIGSKACSALIWKGDDRLTFAVLRFEAAAGPRHGGAQLTATCCVASCKRSARLLIDQLACIEGLKADAQTR